MVKIIHENTSMRIGCAVPIVSSARRNGDVRLHAYVGDKIEDQSRVVGVPDRPGTQFVHSPRGRPKGVDPSPHSVRCLNYSDPTSDVSN